MKSLKIDDLPVFLKEKSGQDSLGCYQCQKCTVGCPVAGAMDIKPNMIHRMIQYGHLERLLKSPSIWICAACDTCGARCPNSIDTGKVIDVLKQMALQKGIRGTEKKVPVMHQAFMDGVRKRGRMHELSLIKDIRLRSGGYFKDWQLGLQMFRLGKLSLRAEKVKNLKSIKMLFKRAGGVL